jgi:hypothetical protein
MNKTISSYTFFEDIIHELTAIIQIELCYELVGRV